MLRPLSVVALALVFGACNSPKLDSSAEATGHESDILTGAREDTAQAPPRPDAAPSGKSVAAATSGEAHVGENETDQTVRLSFEPGASRATVQDTLGRGALHDYRVQASAGQTLTATLRSDGPPTILVMDNEGHSRTAVQPLDWTVNEATTEPAGWRWQGTLPHDGVYWVRVVHSGPAVNGGAWSPYTLTVEIK